MTEGPTSHERSEEPAAPGAFRPTVSADAAALLAGLLLVSRPLTGGLGESFAESALAMLVLLAGAALYLGTRMASGPIRISAGPAAALFGAFLLVACASGALAPDRFAALGWCLVLLTYGLTAGIIFRVALQPRYRGFLWACLLATCIALAGYALWHYALYLPAMRRWLAAEPGLVERAASGRTAAPDLTARIASNRAYGNFLTANQLASFMLLGFFPLTGLTWALIRPRGAHPRSAILAAGGGALLLAALVFSRSKGALIAVACGAVLFVGLGAWVRKVRTRALLAILAVLVLGAACAWVAGLLPSEARLARSFDVRLGYWQTSLEMVARRPLLGVGPGAWADWYGMLKQPGFEDSRNAHSMFLQVAAETGAAGLVLWCALCAVCLWGCFRGAARTPEPPAGSRCPGEFRAAGPLLAAAVLALDYLAMGTFAPPRHAPAWLEGMPWLPYLLVMVLWTAAFLALTGRVSGLWGREAGVGLTAGLAAFLLHSAGEHTLTIPALAGTAAALVGLGLSRRAGKGWRLSPRAGRVALAAAVLLLPVCALAVVRPALVAASASQEAWLLPLLRATGSPVPAAEVSRAHARACNALPCEPENWRRRAAWELGLLQQGAGSLRADDIVDLASRAVDLSPLNSGGWRLLGAARMAAGDGTGGAEAFAQASRLAPTLPLAWLEYGRALERAGAGPERVTAAYAKALALHPLQYSDANRVLGGPAELAAFWQETTGQPVGVSPVALAMTVGDTAIRQEVGRLTGGQPDSGDARVSREVWAECAPDLWRIALEAKVTSLRGAEPGEQMDGASGGT